MGRPTKLTPETRETICKFLSVGATRRDAALAAGVSVSIFHAWLQRGHADREAGHRTRFTEFLEAVEHAEADARLRFIATIAKAAQDGDWRAALEYLKRRDPQHWGDRQALDISSPEPIRIELEVVDKRVDKRNG